MSPEGARRSGFLSNNSAISEAFSPVRIYSDLTNPETVSVLISVQIPSALTTSPIVPLAIIPRTSEFSSASRLTLSKSSITMNLPVISYLDSATVETETADLFIGVSLTFLVASALTTVFSSAATAVSSLETSATDTPATLSVSESAPFLSPLFALLSELKAITPINTTAKQAIITIRFLTGKCAEKTFFLRYILSFSSLNLFLLLISICLHKNCKLC